MENRMMKKARENANIVYNTVILCQDEENLPKIKLWLDSQKDIPYLPNSDHFAYYCPMCNNILILNFNCNNCKQSINWDYEHQKK